MKPLAARLRLKPGAPVDLLAIKSGDRCGYGSKEEAKGLLKADAKAIASLQAKLHADGTRALLVILQGLDTSGKDGTIKAVFGRTSPLGVSAVSFARPSQEALAHDFLWRVHAVCPRRGQIGIFNRSHYEDVLAGAVRGDVPAGTIRHRYDQINGFENLIASSTRILKIMLHISRDTQRERLQARLDEPDKRWKFDPGDLDDRALWPDYIAAYETVLSRCASKEAPWHVVPSDHKWVRNAAVASLVRSTLEDMDPRFPSVDWDPAAYTIEP